MSSLKTETFNASNVVQTRTKADYQYRPEGLRTVSIDYNDANLDNTFAANEKTSSIEYLLDMNNMTGYGQAVVETHKDGNGVTTKQVRYTFGTDEITQTTVSYTSGSPTSSATLTFGHDGHGSTRVLYQAAAAIAQAYVYSAYGELLSIYATNGTKVTPPASGNYESFASTTMLYNGEAFMNSSGFYNFRARPYAAGRGVLIGTDEFAGNPNDPFSFNKHGFAHGDPVNGVDPSGMFAQLQHDSKVASIGMSIINALRSFGSLYFKGPAILSKIPAIGGVLTVSYRAIVIGHFGLTGLTWLIKMMRGQGPISALDDVLAYQPWAIRTSSNILPSTPGGVIREYCSVIRSQKTVPAELLASVLLAELKQYNAMDSISDPLKSYWYDGKASIGIAQINADTVVRLAKKYPNLWPGGYSDENNLEAIEAKLWDEERAIAILATCIESYAKSINLDLSRWTSLSDSDQQRIVIGMTNAKDNVMDTPQGAMFDGSDSGTVYGLEALEWVKRSRLF